MEVIVNGIKTNYLVYGEGKSFVILHGWNSASDRWLKEAEIISDLPAQAGKNCRVIIPDLPGFGKSDKLARPWTVNDYVSWFENFTKTLGITDFYLLGYSFGGALASKIAVKHPQEIEKLFLVAAAVVRQRTARKNFLARISKLAKIFYFMPYYSLFRKAVYKFVIRKSDYVYTEGIIKETYLNVVQDDISYHLPFIKVPTVIIWGDKDQSVSLDNAKFINEKIKNSKLIIIPEADHLLHRKMPELLAEKIIENL